MSKSKANDIDKLVSKKLKMRRIFLGLHQQDLATAINVTVQQIQKYEKAINRISSGRLYALAEFLKVPVNYFFDQSNSNTSKIAEQFVAIQGDNNRENSEQVSEVEITRFIKHYVAISDAKVRAKFMELIKLVTDD